MAPACCVRAAGIATGAWTPSARPLSRAIVRLPIQVIEPRPLGSDRDSRLLLENALNLRLELFEVGPAQSLFRGFDVLGRDAVNDVDRGGASDQQLLGRIRGIPRIDRHRHVGALGQGRHLRRGGCRTDDDLIFLPEEPDRDNAREAVTSGVSEPKRLAGAQELLGARIIQMLQTVAHRAPPTIGWSVYIVHRFTRLGDPYAEGTGTPQWRSRTCPYPRGSNAHG